MSSQVERVNTAWDRIEKWYAEKNPDYKLPVGAAASDIADTETHLGFTLPEELKASLMRHNGVLNWIHIELLSAKRIKDEWSVRAGLVDNGTFDACNAIVEDNEFLQKCWFNKSWVLIDTDCIANGACLDLNPGPKGKVGQIINMDHEMGPSGPLFPDYAAYLENAADLLESGRYEVVDGYPKEVHN